MKKMPHLQRSVKEAFDNLPSGICMFDRNGLIVLCNRVMYRVAYGITGRDLQTLYELEKGLENLPAGAGAQRDGDIFFLPDETAWRFNFENIVDEYGFTYTQVVASDVSAEYKATAKLAENVEKLKNIQTHIRTMTQNIAAVTRENEILSMKMQIHDALGSSLLRLRRYYLGTGKSSKAELLENWRETVSMLKYKGIGVGEGDPIADLMHSAASIGVEIVITGELPKDKAAARLIVRAVRECLTNAVRHAEGNRIFVELSDGSAGQLPEKMTGELTSEHSDEIPGQLTHGRQMVTAVITNDGKPPEDEVTEGGGLSSLRKNIEKAGGTMSIQSTPTFALTIRVPVLPEGWPLSTEIIDQEG